MHRFETRGLKKQLQGYLKVQLSGRRKQLQARVAVSRKYIRIVPALVFYWRNDDTLGVPALRTDNILVWCCCECSIGGVAS